MFRKTLIVTSEAQIDQSVMFRLIWKIRRKIKA